jgi:hypothetical protein
MTPEQRAQHLAALRPETRAKFVELERLQLLADAETRELREAFSIVTLMVCRLSEIVPGASEDPLIKLCVGALDPDAPERVAFRTLVAHSAHLTEQLPPLDTPPDGAK